MHLKTDDEDLFDYTLRTLETEDCIVHSITRDLYKRPVSDELLTLKTTYEKRHLEKGKTIKYLCFGFKKRLVDAREYEEGDPGKRIADDTHIDRAGPSK